MRWKVTLTTSWVGNAYPVVEADVCRVEPAGTLVFLNDRNIPGYPRMSPPVVVFAVPPSGWRLLELVTEEEVPSPTKEVPDA